MGRKAGRRGGEQDALNEIQRYFTKEHRIIIPLTVSDILDEEIARKLA